jgi:hypothetical protein
MLEAQDNKFVELSLKVEDLEKENVLLEEKVLSLEKDVTSASVAFKSIVVRATPYHHYTKWEAW